MPDIFRYHGDRNTYVDIATRGEEHLGLGLTYAITNDGSFIIMRFVVHRNDGQHVGAFTHFDLREAAKFGKLTEDGKPTHEPFFGARLNKFLVKVFAERIPLTNLADLADKLDLWPLLTQWIREQVNTEGFVSLFSDVDLATIVRGELIPAIETTAVTLALSFPDLAAFKAKKAAYKKHAAHHQSDEDEEEDDEDDEETIN